MSTSWILPLKRACTGPIRVATTERHSVSLTRSSDSHPGMHAFSTAGSFKAAHTLAGGAPIPRVWVRFMSSGGHGQRCALARCRARQRRSELAQRREIVDGQEIVDV